VKDAVVTLETAPLKEQQRRKGSKGNTGGTGGSKQP